MSITPLAGRIRPAGRIRAGIAAALALGLLTACGSSGSQGEDGQVTITWTTWSTAEPTTRPGTEELVAAFEAENPGIKVKVEAIPFPDTGNQLLLRLRARNTPAVSKYIIPVESSLPSLGNPSPTVAKLLGDRRRSDQGPPVGGMTGPSSSGGSRS